MFHYMFHVQEIIYKMDSSKFDKTSLLHQIADLYTVLANMEGNLIYFVLVKCFWIFFTLISFYQYDLYLKNHIKYKIILAEKQNLQEELEKSKENKLSITSHVPCTECGTCFVCKTSFSQCNNQMCIMWNSSNALW